MGYFGVMVEAGLIEVLTQICLMEKDPIILVSSVAIFPVFHLTNVSFCLFFFRMQRWFYSGTFRIPDLFEKRTKTKLHQPLVHVFLLCVRFIFIMPFFVDHSIVLFHDSPVSAFVFYPHFLLASYPHIFRIGTGMSGRLDCKTSIVC